MTCAVDNVPPWRCFHCGEVFTTVGAARDHFGETPSERPGCLIDRVAVETGGTPERGRGLLMELRKVQAVNAELRDQLAALKSADAALSQHWLEDAKREYERGNRFDEGAQSYCYGYGHALEACARQQMTLRTGETQADGITR